MKRERERERKNSLFSEKRRKPGEELLREVGRVGDHEQEEQPTKHEKRTWKTLQVEFLQYSCYCICGHARLPSRMLLLQRPNFPHSPFCFFVFFLFKEKEKENENEKKGVPFRLFCQRDFVFFFFFVVCFSKKKKIKVDGRGGGRNRCSSFWL